MSNTIQWGVYNHRPEVVKPMMCSLGLAYAFINAIANVGADAVKFQTHIAAAESTPGEPW